ncbi:MULTISPECIES: YiiD C-terminal domain-containing protein [Devosia]|uniref:YiiD C-terminal domain-containing protein n=1 Tax=Devosia TaxID=46913 RepID=UPI000CE9811F|nr:MULTISPECIES: YiiD C-terminal domain-containing protein [Devosia]AVF05485.1 thioesterase [Devosia sp. I507]
MTQSALAAYLHSHMPLSRAMAVSVVSANAMEVVLEAPLAPNLNMHGTMFGGSIANLALLAAWSVMHLRLEADQFAGQLVVSRSETDYLRPVSGPARALARLDGLDWDGFSRQLNRHGKARLTVTAEVLSDDQIAARLVGTFAAIAGGEAQI